MMRFPGMKKNLTDFKSGGGKGTFQLMSDGIGETDSDAKDGDEFLMHDAKNAYPASMTLTMSKTDESSLQSSNSSLCTTSSTERDLLSNSCNLLDGSTVERLDLSVLLLVKNTDDDNEGESSSESSRDSKSFAGDKAKHCLITSSQDKEDKEIQLVDLQSDDEGSMCDFDARNEDSNESNLVKDNTGAMNTSQYLELDFANLASPGSNILEDNSNHNASVVMRESPALHLPNDFLVPSTWHHSTSLRKQQSKDFSVAVQQNQYKSPQQKTRSKMFLTKHASLRNLGTSKNSFMLNNEDVENFGGRQGGALPTIYSPASEKRGTIKISSPTSKTEISEISDDEGSLDANEVFGTNRKSRLTEFSGFSPKVMRRSSLGDADTSRWQIEPSDVRPPAFTRPPPSPYKAKKRNVLKRTGGPQALLELHEASLTLDTEDNENHESGDFQSRMIHSRRRDTMIKHQSLRNMKLSSPSSFEQGRRNNGVVESVECQSPQKDLSAAAPVVPRRVGGLAMMSRHQSMRHIVSEEASSSPFGSSAERQACVKVARGRSRTLNHSSRNHDSSPTAKSGEPAEEPACESVGSLQSIRPAFTSFDVSARAANPPMRPRRELIVQSARGSQSCRNLYSNSCNAWDASSNSEVDADKEEKLGEFISASRPLPSPISQGRRGRILRNVR